LNTFTVKKCDDITGEYRSGLKIVTSRNNMHCDTVLILQLWDIITGGMSSSG
jgi:hypothetical protein